MDLASELAGSSSEINCRPKIDTLMQDAGEFCQFLVELSSKLDQELENADHPPQATYKDEYSAAFLPPRAISPFSDFTGPDDVATAIFTAAAKAADREDNCLSDGAVDVQEGGNDSCSIREEQGEGSNLVTQKNPFSINCQKSVKLGQQLSQRRLFLTKSELLYDSQGARPTTCTDLVCSHNATADPVPLDRARYLCSLYSLGARSASQVLPTMWVLCDSKSPKKVVAMGSSYKNSVLHTYTIVDEGLVQEPQNTGSGQQTLNLEKNKRRSLGKSNCWAFSEYEISSSIGEDKLSSGHARLVLQFAWADPEALLSPPTESADAVLKIAAKPGNVFSPVLSVYQELLCLLNFCKIASGQAQWPTDDEESTDTVPSLANQVESFLEEAACPLFQPLEVTVISPTADNNVYEPRTDLDFVERLWMFSKEARNLEDLQQVFAAVFKAVLLNKVQPFLHRVSTTILSSLFRNALLSTSNDEKQSLATKFQSLLSEPKLLNCLVQIGLEKLQRDYWSFFVGSDLATGLQLDHFFAGKSDNLFEHCYSLWSLHDILELNAAALSFLNLPTATLSSLTKTALEIYKDGRFEGLSVSTPMFHLPLPAFSPALKSVVSLCGNLSPRMWVLSSQEDLQTATSSEAVGATSVTVLLNHSLFCNSDCMDAGGQWTMYRSQCDSISV